MLDVVADLRTIVLPDVARTIGILQELVAGCPVVTQGDIAGTLIRIKIEPMVGVVDVAGFGNVTYNVL